jgi:hypothetical protein
LENFTKKLIGSRIYVVSYHEFYIFWVLHISCKTDKGSNNEDQNHDVIYKFRSDSVAVQEHSVRLKSNLEYFEKLYSPVCVNIYDDKVVLNQHCAVKLYREWHCGCMHS